MLIFVNEQILSNFTKPYYFDALIEFRLISSPNFLSIPSGYHSPVPDAGKNVHSPKNVLPLTE